MLISSCIFPTVSHGVFIINVFPSMAKFNKNNEESKLILIALIAIIFTSFLDLLNIKIIKDKNGNNKPKSANPLEVPKIKEEMSSNFSTSFSIGLFYQDLLN